MGAYYEPGTVAGTGIWGELKVPTVVELTVLRVNIKSCRCDYKLIMSTC